MKQVFYVYSFDYNNDKGMLSAGAVALRSRAEYRRPLEKQGYKD